MKLPRRKNLRLAPDIYALPGRIFSVTVCTRERAPVFADLDRASGAIATLAETRKRCNNPVYAYCFMPDHVHLLIGIEDTSLPRFMQTFKSLAYRHWKHRKSQPSFWQRGYYERALRRRDDVSTAAMYIWNNPVRAGIASQWNGYHLSGSLEWDL